MQVAPAHDAVERVTLVAVIPLQVERARPFVERLQAHGVEASVIEAKGKDHGALNREMGQPGDPTIDKAIEFMTLRSR